MPCHRKRENRAKVITSPGLFASRYRAQTLLGLGAAAAALSLSALRAVLFLDADEAQSASMLAEDTAALDGLIESSKELLEPLVVTNLNTHKPESPPNQSRVIVTVHKKCRCARHTTTVRRNLPALRSVPHRWCGARIVYSKDALYSMTISTSCESDVTRSPSNSVLA